MVTWEQMNSMASLLLIQWVHEETSAPWNSFDLTGFSLKAHKYRRHDLRVRFHVRLWHLVPTGSAFERQNFWKANSLNLFLSRSTVGLTRKWWAFFCKKVNLSISCLSSKRAWFSFMCAYLTAFIISLMACLPILGLLLTARQLINLVAEDFKMVE